MYYLMLNQLYSSIAVLKLHGKVDKAKKKVEKALETLTGACF